MSELLPVTIERGVCVATVDAPPVNVMTIELFDALV